MSVACSVVSSTPYVVSGIHAASRAGRLTKIKDYIAKGGNVNKLDRESCSPLMWACWGGHLEVVRLLVEEGAQVDVFNQQNASPLHWACWGGHAAIVDVLLRSKPQLEVTDEHDGAPLHYAAKKGYIEVVEKLLEAGADVNNAQTAKKQTPLHLACHSGHNNIVQLLIQRGASLDATDFDQRTPLHHACLKSHLPCVLALTKAGCSLSEVDEGGRTPAELCGQSASRKNPERDIEILRMVGGSSLTDETSSTGACSVSGGEETGGKLHTRGESSGSVLPGGDSRAADRAAAAAAAGPMIPPSSAGKPTKKRSTSMRIALDGNNKITRLPSGAEEEEEEMKERERARQKEMRDLGLLSGPAGELGAAAGAAGGGGGGRASHGHSRDNSAESRSRAPSGAPPGISLGYSGLLADGGEVDFDVEDDDDESVAVDMALEMIATDLMEMEERWQNVKADNKANEGMTKTAMRRIDALETEVRKLKRAWRQSGGSATGGLGMAITSNASTTNRSVASSANGGMGGGVDGGSGGQMKRGDSTDSQPRHSSRDLQGEMRLLSESMVNKEGDLARVKASNKVLRERLDEKDFELKRVEDRLAAIEVLARMAQGVGPKGEEGSRRGPDNMVAANGLEANGEAGARPPSSVGGQQAPGAGGCGCSIS